MKEVKEVSLWVYTEGGEHDEEVHAAVGRKSYGSGYDLTNGERDISFAFGVDETLALGTAVLALAKVEGVTHVKVHALG